MRVLGFALSLMAALTVLRTTSAAGDAGVTDIMQRDPPKADDLPVTTWFACGMLSGGPCDKSLVSGLVNHLTKDVAVLLQSKTGNEVNVTITSLEELQDGCHAQMQIAYVLRTAEDQFNANLVTRILTTTPGNGCAAGGGLPSSCKYLDARKRTFAYTAASRFFPFTGASCPAPCGPPPVLVGGFWSCPRNDPVDSSPMAFSGDRCIYICDGDYDYDSYGTAGIPEATCNAGQYTQKGDICVLKGITRGRDLLSGRSTIQGTSTSSCFATWQEGTNACIGWAGVTCEAGDVAIVDLTNCNLEGTLPESWAASNSRPLRTLPALRELRLTNNPGLNGPIPCNWNFLGVVASRPFLLGITGTSLTDCIPFSRNTRFNLQNAIALGGGPPPSLGGICARGGRC